MHVDDAAVVLHLHLRVPLEQQDAFRAYVAEAFPLFEARGDCRGAVYQAADDPAVFDEVFYYATEEAHQAAERAIDEDPIQRELLVRWRALLAGPPVVSVMRRWS